MTTNQINYFAAKETQRHNLAMEQESARHNIKTEDISHETNIINSSHFKRMDDESVRHNLATEDVARQNLNLGFANLQLGYDKLSEDRRHNQASEGISYQSVLETKRHNMQSEDLISGQLSEDIRHNKEVESETVRVNNTVTAQNLARTGLINAQATGVNLDNAFLKRTLDDRVTTVWNNTVRSKNEAEYARQENDYYWLNTPIRNMGSYFGTGERYYEATHE